MYFSGLNDRDGQLLLNRINYNKRTMNATTKHRLNCS